MTDDSPREGVAFRVQPVESAERAHFGNFALISHTRFAPCGASRHTTVRAYTSRNKFALRLPVANIKPVSKISPVISRPRRKTNAASRRPEYMRATHAPWNARESEFGCVVWRRKSFVFFFPLSHEISLFLSVPFPLPFSVLLPRTLGADHGLCGSTRGISTMWAYIITQRPRIIGILIKRPRGIIERGLAERCLVPLHWL